MESPPNTRNTRKEFGIADRVDVQLEMAECIYMQESSPYTFSAEKAARVRPILREQLAIAIDWAVNR